MSLTRCVHWGCSLHVALRSKQCINRCPSRCPTKPHKTQEMSADRIEYIGFDSRYLENCTPSRKSNKLVWIGLLLVIGSRTRLQIIMQQASDKDDTITSAPIPLATGRIQSMCDSCASRGFRRKVTMIRRLLTRKFCHHHHTGKSDDCGII